MIIERWTLKLLYLGNIDMIYTWILDFTEMVVIFMTF